MIAAVATASLAGCVEYSETTTTGVGMPAVGSAYDLTPFQGAKAGQAEMGIRSLGFEQVRYKGLTSWYFNRETGACAQITTADGRYSEVKMLPAEDC